MAQLDEANLPPILAGRKALIVGVANDHSIAFAPKEALQGRVTDCPRDGFLTAMEVSCWSFLDLARRAEPLMRWGGTMITMSYLGATEVVDNYGVMGPVKAALESAVRYVAA